VKIIIFKVLIASITCATELNQYIFRIQQNLKFIHNNFYKFVKKLCFVSDKHKQRVCGGKLERERDYF
jgi:hypothetical protein